MSAVDTVFLDRDGTLNVKAPEGEYITSREDFVWLPGALEGLAMLTEAGVRLVVVTNQRGIALGRMSEDDLAGIHRRMTDELEAAGGRLAAIHHCPHESGTCDCRKPGTAMFERARDELAGLAFERSAVVGDSESDMLAARRIGALPVFLGDPAGLAEPEGVHAESSLRDAAAWLLRERS